MKALSDQPGDAAEQALDVIHHQADHPWAGDDQHSKHANQFGNE